jgi:WD40 repeat protein
VAVTEKYLSVYDTKSFERKRIEVEDCRMLAMHPLGNLCAISSGHEAHLYNLNNCTLYNSYYSDREVTLIDFVPGGKNLVVGGRGQLKIIQPKTE